jgi:2-dehydropantoate 2-reductase
VRHAFCNTDAATVRFSNAVNRRDDEGDGFQIRRPPYKTAGPGTDSIYRLVAIAAIPLAWHNLAVRFVVFGAGSVGGVVGVRLAEHGHEVAFIARGAHYRAIRDNGLRMETPDGDLRMDIPVVDSPSGIEWTGDDIAILAMKTQDTVEALTALGAAAPATVPVLCMQNGVANERMALRRFPNVYGVYVWCASSHLEAGVVEAWSAPMTGVLDVGRYPSGVDAVATTVAGAFRSSTFFSSARTDVMRWKYRKLLSNLANAVEALCGSAPRSSAVVGEAIREGVACLTAARIPCAAEDEEVAGREKQLKVRQIGDRSRTGGSSWQSLARGCGSIECDYLNGEVVLLGRQFGVPTPVNALLQRLARQAAIEKKAPGSMAMADLEKMLSK